MSRSGPDSEELVSLYSKPDNSSAVNSVKPRLNLINI